MSKTTADKMPRRSWYCIAWAKQAMGFHVVNAPTTWRQADAAMHRVRESGVRARIIQARTPEEADVMAREAT